MTKWFLLPDGISDEILSKITASGLFKNPETILPKCEYIIHKICSEKYKDYYSTKGIRLNFKTLRDILGRGMDSKNNNILRLLQEWGFIQIVQKFKGSIQSSSYKLTEEYDNRKMSLCQKFPQRANDFITKIWKHQVSIYENHPVMKYTMDMLEQHLTLNKDTLQEQKDKYPDYDFLIDHYPDLDIPDDFQLKNIDSIDHTIWGIIVRDFYCKEDSKGGRIYHNISNLKREYRKYLQLDGQHLVELDISNSQPFFSLPLFKQYFAGQELPKDFYSFKEHAINGTLYEVIAEEAGMMELYKIDPQAFKHDKFFGGIWYLEGWKMTGRVAKAFKKLFPDLFEALQNFKEGTHKTFPVALQTLESTVIIHTIARQMYDDGYIFLTLHDSFFVKGKDVDAFKSKIETVCQRELGVIPGIKIKSIPSMRPELSEMTFDKLKIENKNLIPQKICFSFQTSDDTSIKPIYIIPGVETLHEDLIPLYNEIIIDCKRKDELNFCIEDNVLIIGTDIYPDNILIELKKTLNNKENNASHDDSLSTIPREYIVDFINMNTKYLY